MILVPAVHSGDNRVFIWSRTNIATPTHIFNGHTDAVVDIQWVKYERGTNSVTTPLTPPIRLSLVFAVEGSVASRLASF